MPNCVFIWSQEGILIPFEMNSILEAVSTKDVERNEVKLTHDSMGFVNWDCYDDDFEFIAGDNKVCRVPSSIAEFLSPKAARARRCDISFNTYTFTKDCADFFDIFETLILTLSTGSCYVDHSNFYALLRLSQELENRVLLSSLLGIVNPESLTLEEAILLLRGEIAFGIEQFESLRNFVASHFYELKKEILDDLDLKTAHFLLSSPFIQIEDEDSLYRLVVSLTERDARFWSLFEFIHFEYLSIDCIENFVSLVCRNSLENINSCIWARICDRLNLKTETKPSLHQFIPPGIEFEYDLSKPLEGIIAHLARECGGNVHDEGIVNLTASSVWGNWHPKLMVDSVNQASYWSLNEPNTWVCFDFKDRRVIPRSYSVTSCLNQPGGYHLKSWVVEVSDDGTENSWTEIDRRDDNNELNGSNVTGNFKVATVPKKGYRFVRLRQTGRNHYGDYSVSLARMEFFGTLLEKYI